MLINPWGRNLKFRNSRDAIQVELIGGLGNQLFGYVAGLYLAEKLTVDLVPALGKKKAQQTLHGSGIDSFILKYPLSREKVWKFNLRLMFRLGTRRVLRVLGADKEFAEYLSKVHTSKTLGWDPQLAHVNKGSIIQGYYQTYRFLQESKANEKFDLFKLKNPSKWYRTLLEEMLRDTPIVMHVRRGDYTSPVNKDLGILSVDYFSKALTLQGFTESRPERILWIFSDDLESVKNEFRHLEGPYVRWINPPANTDPAESLMLMAQGNGIILSNSSFSWWAAALGNHAKVVAPDRWFRNLDEPEHLIPLDWSRIKSYWRD